MSLTKNERVVIMSMWDKIAPQAESIGTETLERLFAAFPQSKTYFPHFDLHRGSQQLSAHGAKIMAAVGEAVKNLDNLRGAMTKLSELHAYILRVDPVNFKFLSHCMLVTLAARFPSDFTAEVHESWDKFLSFLSSVLTEKYR